MFHQGYDTKYIQAVRGTDAPPPPNQQQQQVQATNRIISDLTLAQVCYFSVVLRT